MQHVGVRVVPTLVNRHVATRRDRPGMAHSDGMLLSTLSHSSFTLTSPILDLRAALRLRGAVRCDLPDLLRLEQACFQPKERYSPQSWCRFMGRHRRSRRTRILVAKLPQRPAAGFILASLPPDSTTTRISMLAVDAEVRGLGLGTGLIGALESRLPARCTHLSLEVSAENDAAQALYDRLGFVPVAPASVHRMGRAGYWVWRAERAAVAAAIHHRLARV